MQVPGPAPTLSSTTAGAGGGRGRAGSKGMDSGTAGGVQHKVRCYSLAHGCLHGHLLAGEESFCVEWDKVDDSVWCVHAPLDGACVHVTQCGACVHMPLCRVCMQRTLLTLCVTARVRMCCCGSRHQHSFHLPASQPG